MHAYIAQRSADLFCAACPHQHAEDEIAIVAPRILVHSGIVWSMRSILNSTSEEGAGLPPRNIQQNWNNSCPLPRRELRIHIPVKEYMHIYREKVIFLYIYIPDKAN